METQIKKIMLNQLCGEIKYRHLYFPHHSSYKWLLHKNNHVHIVYVENVSGQTLD